MRGPRPDGVSVPRAVPSGVSAPQSCISNDVYVTHSGSRDTVPQCIRKQSSLSWSVYVSCIAPSSATVRENAAAALPT